MQVEQGWQQTNMCQKEQQLYKEIYLEAVSKLNY